jgi:hypothetical protein
LDKVLERLDTAEPLESILADYPSQRDELISLLAVVRELSSLHKVPPLLEPEAGLAAFLDEARVLAPEAASRRSRWHWLDEWLVALRSLSDSRMWATARAVTFLALLFVLVGGTLGLSANSLPGDWLYPVKLVGEEARLSLTFSQSARAEYHLQRARNRAEEVQRLVRAGRPVDEQLLARLEGALESSLLAAASADQSETSRLLFAIEQASAEQVALLEVVQVVAANSRTYQLLDQARASLAQAQSLAQMGRANVYAFRLNARLGMFQLGAPSLLLETEPPSATLSPTVTIVTPSGEGSVDEARTFTPTATSTTRPTLTHTPTARPSDTPAPSATPKPSNTPEPPTATVTLALPTATGTFTPTAAAPTNTLQPPEQTNTPQPLEHTNTPQPPEQTNTPQPPGQTNTPQPPGQTKTPQPPGQTKPPKPTKTPKP